MLSKKLDAKLGTDATPNMYIPTIFVPLAAPYLGGQCYRRSLTPSSEQTRHPTEPCRLTENSTKTPPQLLLSHNQVVYRRQIATEHHRRLLGRVAPDKLYSSSAKQASQIAADEACKNREICRAGVVLDARPHPSPCTTLHPRSRMGMVGRDDGQHGTGMGHWPPLALKPTGWKVVE
ncbi:hypothetical protein V495_02897 [Pseudogymnoascus sp. VKM F-4514 (FW-929)]|nr:hypothetical protein V495_02897 [Pseudogymnoascus sp. VKM F-4514 (FW-929)]